MIRISIVEGRNIGARIKGYETPLLRRFKDVLHLWLKDVVEMVKTERLSGPHPFGGRASNPPATGETRESVRTRRPTGARRMRGQVTVGVEHSPFYEYGTSPRWRHPFVRPVFWRETRRLEAGLLRSLSEVLGR